MTDSWYSFFLQIADVENVFVELYSSTYGFSGYTLIPKRKYLEVQGFSGYGPIGFSSLLSIRIPRIFKHYKIEFSNDLERIWSQMRPIKNMEYQLSDDCIWVRVGFQNSSEPDSDAKPVGFQNSSEPNSGSKPEQD